MVQFGFAVPVLPGQVDKIKAKQAELQTPEGTKNHADSLKRRGATQETVWLHQTPDGGHLVVAVFETDDPAGAMAKLGQSTDPYDIQLRAYIKEVHGFDFAGPMPPDPELILNVKASE